MAKFCAHCGKPLEPGVKFCPGCGKPVEDAARPAQPKAAQSLGTAPERFTVPPKPEGNTQKKLIIGGIIVALLASGGGFYYQQQKQKAANEAAAVAAQETRQKEKTAKKADTKQEEDPIQTVQAIMDKEGYSGKVLATSYGHSKDGSLSLIGGKGYRLFLIDEKNHLKAFVSFTPKLYNFIRNKSANPGPITYQMTIKNESSGDDDQEGLWQGKDHVFPIHAEYKFDQDGNVVPGMLYTAHGAYPRNYNDVLKEQRHVDLANLVLTEMQALHDSADAHNVKL